MRMRSGIRCQYVRPFGPKTTPPCRQCGALVEPCRARPVPFCRHGFAPPPATRARFFVDAVPRRAFARAAWKAWNRTPVRCFATPRACGSSTEPDALPSDAITAACPDGAVGSGFGSTRSRGSCFGASPRGCGRGATARVTGRATARFTGLAAALAVTLFAASLPLSPRFGLATGAALVVLRLSLGFGLAPCSGLVVFASFGVTSFVRAGAALPLPREPP